LVVHLCFVYLLIMIGAPERLRLVSSEW
jgi:hypothetical protein